jgi:O-Antigen ligase
MQKQSFPTSLSPKDCQHVSAWLLVLLVVGTSMVIINGQAESIESTPLANYVTAAIIASGAVIVVRLFKQGITISRSLMILCTSYFLGVVVVSFIRSNLIEELPRSIVMAFSIWTGLMMGNCIGSNPAMIKKFSKILLFFGVFIALLSITTNIGVVSAVNGFSIGRSNRLWTTAFGIVDPVSMIAAGLYLLQESNDKTIVSKFSLMLLTTIAFLLLLFSSTRSFLIQTLIILAVSLIAKMPRNGRQITLVLMIFTSLIGVLFLISLSDASNIAILNTFGFVDGAGEVKLEKSRGILNDYLIELTASNPYIGVGMNTVKETAQQIRGAAKTEYGYSLHMASFGVFVAMPFYLVMGISGFFQPLVKIYNSSKRNIKNSNVLYSMSIGAVLAGFNGYYGQATSITQFTYLMWIGISIALCDSNYNIKVSDDSNTALIA